MVSSLQADPLAVSLDMEGPVPLCLTVALESITGRRAHRYVKLTYVSARRCEWVLQHAKLVWGKVGQIQNTTKWTILFGIQITQTRGSHSFANENGEQTQISSPFRVYKQRAEEHTFIRTVFVFTFYCLFVFKDGFYLFFESTNKSLLEQAKRLCSPTAHLCYFKLQIAKNNLKSHCKTANIRRYLSVVGFGLCMSQLWVSKACIYNHVHKKCIFTHTWQRTFEECECQFNLDTIEYSAREIRPNSVKNVMYKKDTGGVIESPQTPFVLSFCSAVSLVFSLITYITHQTDGLMKRRYSPGTSVWSQMFLLKALHASYI